MFLRQFPRSCRGLPPKSVSGVYKIQPLPNIDPIEVYCEMAVGGGGFIFLPRTITKTRGAQKIVNFLFRDRKRVLLKLQRKNDRSESYTLIQPHPNFTKYSFKILVNSYSGYTKPKNHYMSDYFFLGIIPAAKAREGEEEPRVLNPTDVQYSSVTAMQILTASSRLCQTMSCKPPVATIQILFTREAVWRLIGDPQQSPIITNPDRMMPNQFFFLTELHFGGCGCYTSSNRWKKYGFHATAIGVR